MSLLPHALFSLLGSWRPRCVFFSIYEAAPFPSGNYSPQSCVHASDDTDKTWQPRLGREPVFMCKYAARGQAKSTRADRSFQSLSPLHCS